MFYVSKNLISWEILKKNKTEQGHSITHVLVPLEKQLFWLWTAALVAEVDVKSWTESCIVQICTHQQEYVRPFNVLLQFLFLSR